MAMNAELHITTIARDGIITLKDCYCTPPFKVADITENRRGGRLRLVIMSSSPGILDGDQYQLRVSVGEGCDLHLQTQSYQRLFTMKESASQNMEVLMEKGSGFQFLPHPVVPHERSNFMSATRIHLSSGCKLLWGEVFTCGRKLNGEKFQFTRYRSITEISLSGRLIIKENVLMEPLTADVSGLGKMEGYTHQATLICLNETLAVKDIIKTISDQLSTEPQIVFGITAAPANGFILRMLGYKAEQLFDCLKAIALQLNEG